MQIVIVGDGKIGSTLAEQLSREGHDITVIDRSGAPLQQTAEDLDILCVEGNGATCATQKEAGVDNADLLIAVTASDELNLLCCLVAKSSARRIPSRACAIRNIYPVCLSSLTIWGLACVSIRNWHVQMQSRGVSVSQRPSRPIHLPRDMWNF